MGFYQDQVVPLLTSLSMRNKNLAAYRKRVVPEATGRVLEVGIGSLAPESRARRAVLQAERLPLLLDDDFAQTYPRAAAHFNRLLAHPAIRPDVRGYLDKIEQSSAP